MKTLKNSKKIKSSKFKKTRKHKEEKGQKKTKKQNMELCTCSPDVGDCPKCNKKCYVI